MRRALLPVLALALLATNGCVAAALVGAAGAGAGIGYTHANAKKSETAARTDGAAQPVHTTQQSGGVKLLPAPGEFIECTLSDGEHLAMSAADCKAKGGTIS
jgi:hypothetical protein